MDWHDQPAGQPAPFSPSSPTATGPAAPANSPSPAFGGAKRIVATTLLAIGLLGVGGAAVVFAADPSATPAPSATTTDPGASGGTTAPTTPGTRPNGHAKGDCPRNDGSGGTAPNASAAPSTDGSTSSPSTSDL